MRTHYIRCAPVLVAGIAMLTACTMGARESGPSLSTSTPASVGAEQLVNPLDAITDPTSSDFVAAKVTTVLDEQGTGPATFTIPRPDVGTDLRFYVACSPKSEFTVTLGTFFSGPCSPRFANFGQFPLSDGSDPISVTLKLPESVDYWVVAISINQGGTS